MKNKRELLIQDIMKTPLPSATAVNILKLLDNEKTGMKEISNVVSIDPVLTANCLKLVNSPSYGLNAEITSVDRAVNYIGLMGILQLALRHSDENFFSMPLPGYETEPGQCWFDSLHRSFISRKLARLTRPGLDTNLVFTCSLLSDIGKWVLSEYLKTNLEDRGFKELDSNPQNFLELEYGLTGMTHQEAGFQLALLWEFPEVYREVIRTHHQPQSTSEKYKYLTEVIYVSDYLQRLNNASALDSFEYSAELSLLNRFKLESSTLEGMIFEAQVELDDIKNKFNRQNAHA